MSLFGFKVPRYVDETFPVTSVKLDSVKTPTEGSYKGGLVLEFIDTSDNKIYFNTQHNHGYKKGSNVEFHIHGTIDTAGSGVGAENIKLDLTESWANVGGSFPAETTHTITYDVQDITDTDEHIIIEVAASIDGTGKGISSCMICSLERDTSVADNYGGHLRLVSADFHVLHDTNGSLLQWLKVWATIGLLDMMRGINVSNIS